MSSKVEPPVMSSSGVKNFLESTSQKKRAAGGRGGSPHIAKLSLQHIMHGVAQGLLLHPSRGGAVHRLLQVLFGSEDVMGLERYVKNIISVGRSSCEKSPVGRMVA